MTDLFFLIQEMLAATNRHIEERFDRLEKLLTHYFPEEGKEDHDDDQDEDEAGETPVGAPEAPESEG